MEGALIEILGAVAAALTRVGRTADLEDGVEGVLDTPRGGGLVGVFIFDSCNSVFPSEWCSLTDLLVL